MAQIKLLSMPSLDATYKNVVDFATADAQRVWFDNKPGRMVSANIKRDGERETLTLALNHREFDLYDYLIVNEDTSNRRYYYFITGKKFNNENSSVLTLELDVWTTYFWDWRFLDSYVERMHVPRWAGNNPAMELVDEGHVIGEKEMVKTVNYNATSAFIIHSSVPLGQTYDGGYVPPIGGQAGNEWLYGRVSAKGFRYMKGWEGFAAYAYQDSGGVPTIGYGTTPADESNFNDLTANQPVSEEKAARVMYESIGRNYGGLILRRVKEDFRITTQHQFDALADLAYNAGPGVITGDNELTAVLLADHLNEAAIRPIWENFRIRDAQGNVLQGLKTRRQDECNIYFRKTYHMRGIATINPDGSYGPPLSGDGWMPTEGSEENSPTGWTFTNELGVFFGPTKGTVSAVYPEYPEGGPHNGIDIANSVGTPIYAMRGGTVISSGPASGYGNWIRIQSTDEEGNQIIMVYGHMYDTGLLVSVGTIVNAGDLIAKMGNAGTSTGPHLHFQIEKNGKVIAPAPSLRVGDIV